MFTNLIIKDIEDSFSKMKSRESVTLFCSKCDLEFTKPKNYVQGKISKGNTRFYCSKNCSRNTKKEIILECFECKSKILYPNKFCSHSCSASYNNKIKVKKVEQKIVNSIESIKNICKNCNKTCTKKFCSQKCSSDYRYKIGKELWLDTGCEVDNRRLKRYLIDLNGYSCDVCGIHTWNNSPITLEIDHINGNSQDCNRSNVRLICPNCHSQTSTYKSKNKGNGRYLRKLRYQENKSY